MICTAAMNSAPSSRYKTANATITRIRESALWIGSRATISRIAPSTASAPQMKNRMTGKVIRVSPFHQQNDERRHYEICERDGQQQLPPERHELVVAEARERS